MKIGFCAGPERIAEVRDAGFDYIELPVRKLAEMDEAEFRHCRETVLNAGLPALRGNVLFPGTMMLLDGSLTQAMLCDYLKTAFSRAQAMGIQLVVFGSGGSRRRPDGMAYGTAFRKLTEVTRAIGEAADAYGVTVAVEPLNRKETNMMNALAEGACLVAAVQHPRIVLLADYYHVTADGEPVADIQRLGGVAHVHLATAGDRRIPLEPTEGYRQLFAALKATDYAGTVSIEGRCDDLPKEGPKCVDMLKTLWDEA